MLFFFGAWHDDGHLSQEFDSSLNELDVHLRSQGYKKARACAIIIL